MGMAAAFDPGRCQELCALLAEEFYRGDDAVPRSWLCATPWAQPSGTGPELRTRAVRGAGVLPALRTDNHGVAARRLCGVRVPLFGGFAAAEVTPFLPPGAEEPGFSRPNNVLPFPAAAPEEPGFSRPDDVLPFPAPAAEATGSAGPTAAPPFPPPAVWGSAFSRTRGPPFPVPRAPPEQPDRARSGSAPAPTAARTPRIAPAASPSAAAEPAQLPRPGPSWLLVAAASPGRCRVPARFSSPSPWPLHRQQWLRERHPSTVSPGGNSCSGGSASPSFRPVTVPSGSQPALGFSDPDPFVNVPPPVTRWAPSPFLAGHSDSDDEPRPVPRPGRAAVGKGRQRRAESASARDLWTLPPRRVTVSPDKPRSFWDAVKARLSEAEDEGLLGRDGKVTVCLGGRGSGDSGGQVLPQGSSGQTDRHGVIAWRMIQELRGEVAKHGLGSQEVMQALRVTATDLLCLTSGGLPRRFSGLCNLRCS